MTIPNRTIDFVYVLTNKSMPGLVKIGFSSWLPEDRAKSLYTTGVPEPFEVAYYTTTSWPKAVESKVHQLLNDYRVNPGREFFRVTVAQAINTVRYALVDAASINSWKDSGFYSLVSEDRVSLTLKSGQIFALLSYSDLIEMMRESPGIIDLWQAHSDGDVLEIYATDSPGYVSGISDHDPESEEDPVPYLDRNKTVVNGLINGRERLMPGDRLVWLPAPEDAKEEASVVFATQSHCQIVSRTWSPVFGPDGLPLLLNDFLYGNVWPEAHRSLNDALKSFSTPRNWAPRQERDSSWAQIGSNPPPADYWLPQLKRRKRKKK
ncbi:GIY-YIG nuclease family protein [Nodosilinea sp. LEGE 06152]|uniref:GIY-YIG nuclease family protein n=1 Tax=Nodosilinea sp. LEGE 06152 TaxID=2777966 RepID=UPI00187EA633|nr:GIY-YIG nuclease family protein [Nodosilinea sp. LEGE 06152]